MSLLFENELWEKALTYGERIFVPKNTTIYEQGETGDGCYFLKKGLVEITTKTANGSDFLLKMALPNNLFGLESMDELVHFTTAKTVKDSVLYFFPYHIVHDLMQKKPALERFFLEAIIKEMNILSIKIFESNLSAKQKIARILLNVYEENRHYGVQLKQKDIANSTGVSRVTVYKVIEEFERNGCIKKLDDQIVVTNDLKLRQYAE